MSNYYDEDRKAGWIELFFDLAYVVLLGRMGHLLLHTHYASLEFESIVNFIWIFVVQFFVWMLFTIYLNIYGNDSNLQNFLGFSLLTCLIINTILMSDIRDNASYISLSLGVMCLIISIAYFTSRYEVKENTRYAKHKSAVLMLVAILTIPVVFMKDNTVVIYITIIYTIEHIFAEIAIRKYGAAKPNGEHLVERIGTFMILIFGEVLIVLVDNTRGIVDRANIFHVIMMALLVFSIWMNYFTNVDKLKECRYETYSQILFQSFLVMFALTLLPAIIYHSNSQQLGVKEFNGLVLIFAIFFFVGNGFSYIKITSLKRIVSYSIGAPTILGIIIFTMQTYVATVIALVTTAVTTAFMMLWQNLKIKSCSEE